MGGVDSGAEIHGGSGGAGGRPARARGGLAPTRRIYRNYAWVIVLACVSVSLWGFFTVKNKDGYMRKDSFDEAGTVDQFGALMMLAEQGGELPAVERWLLGIDGPGETARSAAGYLEYADGERLLTGEGKVMLACLHWSMGNEEEARKTVEPVGGGQSPYAGAVRELLAGRPVDDGTWDALDGQIRTSPRDWVACFLAEKAAALRHCDEAVAMTELVHERRQSLLVTGAKVAVIVWLVFLAGAGCLVSLARRCLASKVTQPLAVPRLTRLWPLSLVLVAFVLGDAAAGLVHGWMWFAYSVLPGEVGYTGFLVVSDVVYRGLGAVLLMWFFLRRPEYVRATLLRPVPHLWQWVLAAFTVVWGIDLALYSMPEKWFPFDPTVGFQWFEYGWEGLLTSMVSGAVLAPLFEEFVFRGFLFNGLKNRIGLHAAAAASAVVFAGVHFYGVQDLVAVGLFGLVMAYLYHLTRSLWPCILCHALVNFLITLWEWSVLQSPAELWEIR